MLLFSPSGLLCPLLAGSGLRTRRTRAAEICGTLRPLTDIGAVAEPDVDDVQAC